MPQSIWCRTVRIYLWWRSPWPWTAQTRGPRPLPNSATRTRLSWRNSQSSSHTTRSTCKRWTRKRRGSRLTNRPVRLGEWGWNRGKAWWKQVQRQGGDEEGGHGDNVKCISTKRMWSGHEESRSMPGLRQWHPGFHGRSRMEKTPRPSLSDKMVRKTKRGIFHEGKQRTKPRASGEEKKWTTKFMGRCVYWRKGEDRTYPEMYPHLWNYTCLYL